MQLTTKKPAQVTDNFFLVISFIKLFFFLTDQRFLLEEGSISMPGARSLSYYKLYANPSFL